MKLNAHAHVSDFSLRPPRSLHLFFFERQRTQKGRDLAAVRPKLKCWWGINGATSVFGSVLAAVIALAYGISASYWTGVACYAVAVAALAWQCRRDRPLLHANVAEELPRLDGVGN